MSDSLSMNLVKTLLMKYHRPTAEERAGWQARVMDLEGVNSQELTRLHGELLAQGWIEQNTEVALVPRGTFLESSYRITSSGVRRTRDLQESLAEELDS